MIVERWHCYVLWMLLAMIAGGWAMPTTPGTIADKQGLPQIRQGSISMPNLPALVNNNNNNRDHKDKVQCDDQTCRGDFALENGMAYIRCTRIKQDAEREEGANTWLRMKDSAETDATMPGKRNVPQALLSGHFDDSWCFVYPQRSAVPLRDYFASLRWQEMLIYGPAILRQIIEGLSYLSYVGIGHEGISATSIMVNLADDSREPTVLIDDYHKTTLYGPIVPPVEQKRMMHAAGNAIYTALTGSSVRAMSSAKRTMLDACLAQIEGALCIRPPGSSSQRLEEELFRRWRMRYPESNNPAERKKIAPFVRNALRLLPDDPEQRLTPDQFLARRSKTAPIASILNAIGSIGSNSAKMQTKPAFHSFIKQ
ncbi:hypothetical protein SYNPS1DRAFT_32031 [Syncephalis pseudoplumigaleata]|uniref:Protein kinase domain-containing protein n=1 Tax=Syncephalis pseudoplumigaleata TaxID=1712513 RepID=A0A4P9YSP1_9FUNG|nr:hypothetical protein SYNPS1DRAFT_32031 [Syncephalis pseudoplumigaleata]|eukprot:RKP22382.1 hypothetical protein SYNPS1DRAFT_32031 [Syncephalis pseudoplumigaleata]